MGFFSDHTREQVRAASDIVDVIGACLPLKRAGANFVTLCPFHKEKSPSFNVNPGKQIFHCFGCGKGGDVFRFVQEYENLTFPEAVRRLAERARIPLEEEQNPAAQQARGVKDALLKLHEAICQRWQQCLANEAAGQPARDYLARRGVGPDAVREFRLGAAPEAWDDTVNWAKARGFDARLCEQAGLIIRKEDTGRLYDRFRGRLMFPIGDEQGRVIAFSGRVLDPEAKAAKYVNSPETPIFTKGRVLYALDKAKRAILDAGHAIVCEGQLDTIACHAAGIRQVVAPQGTALTGEHARILKRFVDEVVLCFDGDKAGRNAAVRALDDCLGSGLAIKVASIPPPDDPDSFLKGHGVDAFRQVLGRAQGFFDFYLQHLTAENEVSSDKGRLAVVRGMAEKLHKTGNAVLLDTYAQRTAQRLGVAVDAVRLEFKKARPSPGAAMPVAEELPSEPEAGADPAPPPVSRELWLLKYLFHADADALAWALAHLDPAWVQHPKVRRIVELRLGQAGGENPSDLGPVLQAFDEDEAARRMVTEAASERRVLEDPKFADHARMVTREMAHGTEASGVVVGNLIGVVRKVRDAWIDRQVVQLGTRLADPSLPEAEQFEILRQRQQLVAWKRSPLAAFGES